MACRGVLKNRPWQGHKKIVRRLFSAREDTLRPTHSECSHRGVVSRHLVSTTVKTTMEPNTALLLQTKSLESNCLITCLGFHVWLQWCIPGQRNLTYKSLASLCFSKFTKQYRRHRPGGGGHLHARETKVDWWIQTV